MQIESIVYTRGDTEAEPKFHGDLRALADVEVTCDCTFVHENQIFLIIGAATAIPQGYLRVLNSELTRTGVVYDFCRYLRL